MEDQKADLGDHAEASSDKLANQSARAGGQAKGGNAAQPGDPTSPAQAQARAAASNAQMAKYGFGDHKGEDMGRDGTRRPHERNAPTGGRAQDARPSQTG